jgi:20S proteasome alpha/beta subunit
MTIAAGFLCSDGIVLASDTLHSGINKRYAAKMWIKKRGDTLLAVAGSGTTVLLNRAKEDILEQWSPSMSVRDVRNVIDNVLYGILFKHKAERNNQPPINLLIGVRAAGRCSMYESDGHAMLGPVVKHRACIGWGGALGLYFADSLFRKHMSMKWAEIIAAHLIKQTKAFADGCGGRTHILKIPRVGVPTRATPSDVRNLEGYFTEIDTAMKAVLPAPGVSEQTLGLRLERLNAAIRKTWKVSAVAFDIPSGELGINNPHPPLALLRAIALKD